MSDEEFVKDLALIMRVDLYWYFPDLRPEQVEALMKWLEQHNGDLSALKFEKHTVHVYDQPRLIGFPGHDYFANYCKCGKRQPDPQVAGT